MFVFNTKVLNSLTCSSILKIVFFFFRFLDDVFHHHHQKIVDHFHLYISSNNKVLAIAK